MLYQGGERKIHTVEIGGHMQMAIGLHMVEKMSLDLLILSP
jgi:hypothetical protein